MKRIAIVSGASGGIGKEFISILCNEEVEEIWCVARNKEKLERLKSEHGEKIVVLPLDLSDKASLQCLQERLTAQQATVNFLINNAGVGERLCPSEEFSIDQIYTLINVNCAAVAALCTICIPFMKSGSKIINIASQSAFQPVPYLNLYASSKVFVRNYTRALNMELKKTGITATAVCPGWVNTDMLVQEINGIKVKYPGIVSAQYVAKKAMLDVKKNKDSSICTIYVKYMHLLAKVFPQKTVMKTWVSSIKRYIAETKQSG